MLKQLSNECFIYIPEIHCILVASKNERNPKRGLMRGCWCTATSATDKEAALVAEVVTVCPKNSQAQQLTRNIKR